MHRLIQLTVMASLAAVFGFAQASVSTSLPWNYRIELTQDTGGLDIVVTPFAGVEITVGVENRSDKTARCTAGFADHQHKLTPTEMRHTTIVPGKRATLGYPARKFGEFQIAYVDVKCVETTPAP